MGLDREKRFHRYHRVLSRASWSSREAGRILLGLLLEAFVGEGPLILGIDETLERRYGKKIAARGVSTAIQSVPPTRPSSRAAASDGFARCCWWRSTGLRGHAPCLSSRLWPLPSVMPPGGVDGIRR